MLPRLTIRIDSLVQPERLAAAFRDVVVHQYTRV